MKRRLNTLKGKKLVTGDPNLMTKDEICINETPNGVEVKEIGTDGKIKDLANSGGGNSKEYDDLNTYLYYDDRIISMDGMEFPLCGIIMSILSNMLTYFHNLNIILKINNTEDVFGINYGNYIPLSNLVMEGSGFNQELFLLINGISIPKYVLPENIMNMSGVPVETDKIYIFDFIKLVLGEAGAGDLIEFIKTQPTITREEFFDLLK
jgi:hypothetical protein